MPRTAAQAAASRKNGARSQGPVSDDGKALVNSPENIRAYEWVASYTKKLGLDAMQRFRSGFGNFASPQNPFLSGKIGMIIQGVWMWNFIQQMAPGMQWGAAPFPVPADHAELYGISMAEADVLVIPKGGYVSWDDFSEKASDAEMAAMTRAVGEVARMVGADAQGYRMLSNAGKRAGQEVPHFHVHIFGGQPLGPMLSR